jgi:hypothetical protein
MVDNGISPEEWEKRRILQAKYREEVEKRWTPDPKTRSKEITPYWHDEVKKHVIEAQQGVIPEENMWVWLGELHDHYFGGVEGEIMSPGSESALEYGETEETLDCIHGSLRYLMVPYVAATIYQHRARLRNAIGRDEWDREAQFFEKLKLALMGFDTNVIPGVTRWFHRCIKLEFKATTREVSEKLKEYESLSEKEKEAVSRDEYLRRELESSRFEFESDQPRSVALALMAQRWNVTPDAVKNWLKPARNPYTTKGPIPEILIGFENEPPIVLQRGRPAPKATIGRPRKGDRRATARSSPPKKGGPST